jgi:hypothetical protein
MCNHLIAAGGCRKRSDDPRGQFCRIDHCFARVGAHRADAKESLSQIRGCMPHDRLPSARSLLIIRVACRLVEPLVRQYIDLTTAFRLVL